MQNDAANQNTNPVPPYYNPHNTPQDLSQNYHPHMTEHFEDEDPQTILKKKYPIKTIASGLVVFVLVLAVPVTVYLARRPTSPFLEAGTPTPAATFPPTPTVIPTPSPSFLR